MMRLLTKTEITFLTTLGTLLEMHDGAVSFKGGTIIGIPQIGYIETIQYPITFIS